MRSRVVAKAMGRGGNIPFRHSQNLLRGMPERRRRSPPQSRSWGWQDRGNALCRTAPQLMVDRGVQVEVTQVKASEVQVAGAAAVRDLAIPAAPPAVVVREAGKVQAVEAMAAAAAAAKVA
eukprot:4281552-Prymnesium_polylepis.1